MTDSENRKAFPIVCIGASAGGLEPLREFFGAMPTEPPFAFVVIMHLAPRSTSHMAEILGRVTAMPVTEAADGKAVEPRHVYVIAPGKTLAIQDGVLRMADAPPRPVVSMPIDFFMRSLAEDQQERAIGIILSGTDQDGVRGARAIKAGGGMVMAQAPDTAQHDSMPRNAIAAGVVDFTLPASEMPRALVEYARHAKLAPAADARPEDAGGASAEHIARVLALLKLRLGTDFRPYKPAMLIRRVLRRMGLNRIANLGAYVQLLRDSPDEAQALHADFLIGVTEFFREPEAWTVLEGDIVPRIVESHKRDEPLRIWVPACATGEEAYSLAMIFLEALAVRERNFELCVFATDIDREALEVGRCGRYPESISASVGRERLARFFQKMPDGYQVKSSLRKAVIFAPQNVITDPPFSRIDLVSCRNLLIYLDAEVQRQLLGVLHFALRPGGYLFLGKSEGVGSSRLFEPVAKSYRIYRSVGYARQPPMELRFHEPPPAPASAQRAAQPPQTPREPNYAEIVHAALLEGAPAAVLLDRHHRVLYFHGDLTRFLAQPAGTPTDDLLAMVREPMRVKLRAALHEVMKSGVPATFSVAADATNLVSVSVRPATKPEGELLLATFEHRRRRRAAMPGESSSEARETLRQLEAELEATRRELQGAVEELESANEELKVSNEEAMSMNEELQSANEELQTSKEELQSLNEELTAVNHQLEEKVDELERANDDLSNLLGSTDIPTLFLDRELRIKRYTPASTRLFSLIASDINRPITDIAGRPESDSFVEDARRVLQSLAPAEKELRSAGGEFYLRRVRPYRTQDDRIAGVVVTFTDITALRRGSLALQESETRFKQLAESAPALIQVDRADGNAEFVNRVAIDYTGRSKEALAHCDEWMRLVHLDEVDGYRTRFMNALQQRTRFEMDIRLRRFDGEYRWMKAIGVPRGGDGQPADGMILCLFDIHDRKTAEQSLAEADRRKDEFLAMLAHELRNPLAPIRNAANMIRPGDPPDENLVWVRDVIERQVAHLTRLIDDLLDVSRITGGRIQLHRQTVSLRTIVEDAVEAARPLLEQRGHKLEVSVAEEPLYIAGDLVRLVQIVSNLLNNAMKYSDERSTIRLSALRSGTYAEIRVADQGIGISQEMLQRVFDLFTQEDRSLDRARGGLGVGLTLVQRLVEMHGGRVQAYSAGPGRGSEFVVSLPLAAAPTLAPAAPQRVPASPPCRIMVVDDNVDAADTAARMLALCGHHVKTAYSGEAALSLVGAFKPEIVFLDIGLPGMDGYQVAQKLREQLGHDVYLVAISGYGQREDIERSRAAGFDQHLTKPVELGAMEAVVGAARKGRA